MKKRRGKTLNNIKLYGRRNTQKNETPEYAFIYRQIIISNKQIIVDGIVQSIGELTKDVIAMTRFRTGVRASRKKRKKVCELMIVEKGNVCSVYDVVGVAGDTLGLCCLATVIPIDFIYV